MRLQVHRSEERDLQTFTLELSAVDMAKALSRLSNAERRLVSQAMLSENARNNISLVVSALAVVVERIEKTGSNQFSLMQIDSAIQKIINETAHHHFTAAEMIPIKTDGPS